jgi:hypothetical protein
MQGVGKRKIKTHKFYFLEKCKLKRLSLGLLTMEEEERRVGKIVPQLRRFLLDVLGPQMGCSSSFLVQTCNKLAKKARWKNWKKDQNIWKIYVRQTIIFLCKNQQAIYI